MARLHEYQCKALLAQRGIAIPKGEAAASPEEARRIAEEIGGPVAVKAQAWVTGRAGRGAIKFADMPAEAEAAARELLGMQIGNFVVEQVLVEQKLDIAQEFYAGVIVDDGARAPVVVFGSVGGTGVEERAASVGRRAVDIRTGLLDHQARDLARQADVHGKLQMQLGGLMAKLYQVVRTYEARSGEINPIALTADGKLVAADARMTIDDYAVFRHPELGIEIAREFDRPPTELERIAYNVEAGDYRGTFYFIQLDEGFEKGQGVIGFHGAGGGGSMMSMDAVLRRGYRLANFVDTSGNPPASKVYRAAKIILSQPGIDGYFASGSGVASQEQFHSARGLVKAFLEERLSVPAVIRLGGNAEEQAIAILERAAPELPAPLEGYGKDDTADFCAGRLDTLIKEPPVEAKPRLARPEPRQPYSFETLTGTVIYDHAVCAGCESKVCVETCVPKILRLEDGLPVLDITPDEAKKGRCTECLACEVECHFLGAGGGYVDLPIAGLDEYRERVGL